MLKLDRCLKQSILIRNKISKYHPQQRDLFLHLTDSYCQYLLTEFYLLLEVRILLSQFYLVIIIMQWERDSSDYELARGLAQAIGLADRPPLPIRNTHFISNSPPRRERTRRPNTGDFQQVGRQLNSRRVRERQQFLLLQQKMERQHLIRKNAVKDVFINFERPQDSPIVHAKTKVIISKNDATRIHKYQQQQEVLRKISCDKSKRSRILGDMLHRKSEEMLGEESHFWDTKPLSANFFFQPKLFLRSKAKKQRNDNLDKLAESFQLSRFSLIKRQGELHLESRCERRTQTAQTGRKTVQMRFKEDKCEMLYPNASESASFFSQ